MRVASRSWMLGLVVVAAIAGVAQALPKGDSPEQVARTFYDAFVKGDVPTMTSCYAPDVKFQDEIFSFKDRKGVMGMWSILTNPSGGSKFRYSVLDVKGEVVTVKWIADYKFPLTGRPVHNEITATLTIRDGQIVQHRDAFPWGTWAKQAFPFGGVSDWSPVRWVLKTALRAGLYFQIWNNERKAEKAEKAAAKASKPIEPLARPTSRGLIDRIR